jgi:hypothetical protein
MILLVSVPASTHTHSDTTRSLSQARTTSPSPDRAGQKEARTPAKVIAGQTRVPPPGERTASRPLRRTTRCFGCRVAMVSRTTGVAVGWARRLPLPEHVEELGREWVVLTSVWIGARRQRRALVTTSTFASECTRVRTPTRRPTAPNAPAFGHRPGDVRTRRTSHSGSMSPGFGYASCGKRPRCPSRSRDVTCIRARMRPVAPPNPAACVSEPACVRMRTRPGSVPISTTFGPDIARIRART